MNWNIRIGPLRLNVPATGLSIVAALLILACCVIVPCLVGAGI